MDNSELRGECHLDWRDVCVIGEYTLALGPSLEDHFLAVVTRSGQVFSYGEHTYREVVAGAAQTFGLEIKYQLLGTTDNASVVLYPSELAGRALLEVVPAFSGWRALVDIVKNAGTRTLLFRLTPELRQHIGASSYGYMGC